MEYGGVLVRRRYDLQAAPVADEPDIARTEYGERGFFEFCPEVFRRSELPSHFSKKFWGRARRPGLLHAFKIESVVENSSCIVADRRLKMTGERTPGADQLFQRVFLKRRIFFHDLIQVVDICLKMAVMVEMHCFLVDEWLQGVISVWKREIHKRKITVHFKSCRNLFYQCMSEKKKYDAGSAYAGREKAA